MHYNVASTVTNAGETVVFAYPDYCTYLRVSFLILFITIGTPANLLTIIAVLKSTTLRQKIANIFVVALSCVDLTYCVVNMPLEVVRFLQQDLTFGMLLCRMKIFLFYEVMSASLLLMTFIAINRYVAVAHPQKCHDIFTRRSATAMIVFCVLLPFALLTPTLLGAWGEFGYYPTNAGCDFAEKNGQNPKILLLVILALLTVPTSVVCYLAILVKSWKSRKRFARHSYPTFVKRERAMTRMVFIIFATFTVSWLPAAIVDVAFSVEDAPLLITLTKISLYALAAINPFIYGLTNKNYRQAYRSIFQKTSDRWRLGSSLRSSTRTSTTTRDSSRFHKNRASSQVHVQNNENMNRNEILENSPMKMTKNTSV